MSTNIDFQKKYKEYGEMLYRIAFVFLGNPDDTEDILQEVFITLLYNSPEFKTKEHEKAWLIKVATNTSKNAALLKKRRKTIDLDELKSIGIEDEDSQVFECILALPVKYKIVMTLFYIEGYKTDEISKIVGASPEAVRKRLQKGRELLKTEIERCNGDVG